MPVAQTITFGGGGDPDSGPSAIAIVALVLVLLVVLPAVLGLLLRLRDARRRDDVRREEPKTREPPESPVFGGSWGRGSTSSIWSESSRYDWMMVAVLAVAVLIGFVLTQF